MRYIKQPKDYTMKTMKTMEPMTKSEFLEHSRNPEISDAVLYGMVTKPEWGVEFARLIPQHLQGGLLRWIACAVPAGHFMQAVLSNNLFEAFNRGDQTSAAAMKNIVVFLQNYAPFSASKSHFESWEGLVDDGT
jgi:hypothetical protein